MIESLSASAGTGKYHVEASVSFAGDDLTVCAVGGERNHIGACAIASTTCSFDNESKESYHTIRLLGHREDQLAEECVQRFSERYHCTAVATVGIHIDNATKAEIADLVAIFWNVISSLEDLLDKRLSEQESNATVILVDRKDNALGAASKRVAHRDNLLHRAFSIFLYNNDSFLLQKRSSKKYHSGGLWTNTCCSHPHPGEPINDAAHKRLLEEADIDIPSFDEIFTFIYQHTFTDKMHENEFDHVLVAPYSGRFNANPDEIDAMQWVSFSTIKKELTDNPGRYSAWFAICAPQVIECLVSR